MCKVLKIVLFLSLVFSAAAAPGQSKFRIENKNEVAFIIPPKIKLEFKDRTIKESYKFFFIQMADLSGDYLASLEAINNATSYHSKNENGRSSDGGFNFPVAGCEFCMVKDEGNGFVLRIAYGAMFKKGMVVADFSKLGSELLQYFAAEEKRVNHANKDRPEKDAWAGSISQNIVEKIFEVLPIPQEASLSRFGFLSGDSRVVMPLNPKFTLQVDISLKNKTGPDTFRYDLISQIQVHLFRRQFSGTTDVFVKLRPFLAIPGGAYKTNNYFADDLVLLSSSGDMQMSSAINSARFVAFYEGLFKRNNSGLPTNSQMMAGTPAATPTPTPAVVLTAAQSPCTETEPEDCILKQNSYLLFSNDMKSFYETSSPQVPPVKTIKAVFGERNSITPLLSISINGEPLNLPLSARVVDLVQSGKLPGRFKMSRLYRNRYSDFKDISMQTLLLPGDRFSF